MDVLEQLSDAIDAVCAAEPARLADRETILALHRELDRLEAATTRATAAFDAGGTWEAEGARSAAAWLATRARVAMPVARRRLRLGRALRHMAHAESAWLAGDIDATHVAALAEARTPASEACFGRDEAHAGGAGHAPEPQAVRHRPGLLVPARGPRRHRGQRPRRPRGPSPAPVPGLPGQLGARRGLRSPRRRGARGALEPIEQELFATDWAEARARVGEGVCLADLARTPAQRRADAMVELARRAGAVPPGARLPEPLFSVLVDYSTFAGRICELANGTVVSPGSLVPWLDEAWVERVVFDGPDRVKNLGVRRRIFTGATRRAVELRDRECFHEFCEVPAEHCQIDHIQPYAAGGLTVDDQRARRLRLSQPPASPTKVAAARAAATLSSQ